MSEDALENGATVVNMSLGWPNAIEKGYSFLNSVLAQAYASGVVVVTAAGNRSQSNPSANADDVYPANQAAVLTVSGVDRDLALLVDRAVKFADIEAAARKAGGKLLKSVRLFDVYEGKQIPEGKKSVAYSVTFRADDRTLTDDEISAVFDKILAGLKEQLGAELR